jgi:hypothetical protein
MTKRNRIIFALCSLVGVVALGSYALRALRRAMGAGEFNRPRFEAIVAEVRSRTLPTCATCVVEFRLDDLSNPQSLRPWKTEELMQRGEGAGHIWAKLSEDRKLKVVIETRDYGHAGEYGFAYSDEPLTKESFSGGSDWYRIDVPSDLNLVSEQIDEHWWSVLYNLD